MPPMWNCQLKKLQSILFLLAIDVVVFFFFFGEQRSRGGQMKPEKWNKSTTKWNIARLRFEQKKNRRNKIKQMNTECKRFKNQM